MTAPVPPKLHFDQKVARLFRASRYAERICVADPAALAWLAATGEAPLSADLPGAVTEPVDGFDAILRRARRRFMLHLIYRDVNGLADFHEAVSAISQLADNTVAATIAHHQAALTSQYGTSAADTSLATPLVVGMGKLGGRELNASSDIDLIFLHESDGAASASRSWHEFHSELGRRLIKSLDEINALGFVFRVDMRLRPYGTSGPLVSSISTLEEYFRSAARPWERYAWLKARLLSGQPVVRTRVEALVAPFVYRRYHDYAAIDEMRTLHAQIRAEANLKRRHDDIKVGVGGIREVEFVVQLPQLVRGGREQRLQSRSTRDALSALGELGLMPTREVDALRAAYLFLRTLEHRLQYLDDQQTQALPANEEDRQRIAESLGAADWAEVLCRLNAHREVVSTAFEDAFRLGLGDTSPAPSAPSARPTGGDTVTNQTPNSPIDGVLQQFFGGNARVVASLANAESSPAALAASESAIRARIATWQGSARAASLSPKMRQRIEELLPSTLRAALSYDCTPTTFFRAFDLIEAVDKRETYLALLAEYPGVLNRVAHLGAKSAWASDLLKRHPVLLDEFVTPKEEVHLDWRLRFDELRTYLRAQCDAAGTDIERQYEILRHTKQVVTLQLNLADLEGRLSVMALSDELSALADLLLETTIVLVARSLGLISDGSWNPPPGYAVLGYGKLGSKELGYASDLDLVFLFDPDRLTFAAENVARFSQRINSWLNTMTAGGVLYETDLRLRPDGASGLMAASLDSFAEYQRNRAWVWEHQALTRARWCAGDAALIAPFDAIRTEILTRKREGPERHRLRQQIIEMREKMRAEKKDRGDALDLKHTRGGIVDIEFIVQYLILAYSNEHREFVGNLGNFALLTRAGALGIVEESEAAGTAKAYLAYRQRQHHARTNNETKTWISPDELKEERRVVERTWRSLLPES